MEFVPIPSQASTLAIDVPVLEDVPYQIPGPGEFSNFVERYGIRIPVENDIAPRKLAGLIQSWLFFGLLTEFLGCSPDFESLTRIRTSNDSGEERTMRVLNMAGLHQIPFRSQDRLRLVDNHDSLLNVIRNAKARLEELEQAPAANISPVPEVALSSHILIDALESLLEYTNSTPARQGNFPRSGFLDALRDDSPRSRNRLPSSDATHLDSGYSKRRPSLQIILNRMRRNGWCPSLFPRICRALKYPQLYHISFISRRHPRSLDHRNCSGRFCEATALLEQPIDQPQHLQEKCTCDLIGVPFQKVIDILERGKIPLVKVTRDSKGSISLDIVPAKVDSRYIAISHVWSDGLGNVDNTVYSCQLEKIVKSISRLPVHGNEPMSSSVFDKYSTAFPIDFGLLGCSPKFKTCDLFWLDILCIPTKTAASYGPLTPQMYLDLRQRAISQISAVFAGAAQVLIMDAEMQKLRRGTSQLPEIYALFLACNWSTRAWTFQEMSQSLKCSVQLLDGAFNPCDPIIEWRDWRGFTFDANADIKQPWSMLMRDDNSAVDLQSALARSFNWDFIQQAQDNLVNTWHTTAGHTALSSSESSHPQSPRDKDSSNLHSNAWLFTQAWNNLLTRSCTNNDDLITMFALILQLSLYELRELAPEDRFKAILWSLDFIPIEMFMIPYNFGDVHQGRSEEWIPNSSAALASPKLYPLRYPDRKRPRGYFSQNKQVISIQVTSGSAYQNYPYAIVIIPQHPLSNSSWVKFTYHDQVYLIKFHYDPGRISFGSGFAFLIDPQTAAFEDNDFPGRWSAGCCFLTNGGDKYPIQVFHAVYLSPISVMHDSKERFDNILSELAEKIPIDTVVNIEPENGSETPRVLSSSETPMTIRIRCGETPSHLKKKK